MITDYLSRFELESWIEQCVAWTKVKSLQELLKLCLSNSCITGQEPHTLTSLKDEYDHEVTFLVNDHARRVTRCYNEPAWFRHWIRKVQYELDIEEEREIPITEIQKAIQSIALSENHMKNILLTITNKQLFLTYCSEHGSTPLPEGRYINHIDSNIHPAEELFDVLVTALMSKEDDNYKIYRFNKKICIMENDIHDTTGLYTEIAIPYWIEGLLHMIVYHNNERESAWRNNRKSTRKPLETYNDILSLIEEGDA